MTTTLEAAGLGKRYGRIAAPVGANGAGKSTLLHLAVDLLRPRQPSTRSRRRRMPRSQRS
jgi:ABC-2 type transport system ATP-binding protein